MDWKDASIWLAVGFAGNAIFFMRFLVQWIASERRGRSYVPIAFWWLSIVGSLVLLLYAIHRRDPVFTLAFLPNSVVYVRNLMLIRKERRALAQAETALAAVQPDESLAPALGSAIGDDDAGTAAAHAR
jgi:lipid-A-disaccharide synthase-like uncharacterized protein